MKLAHIFPKQALAPVLTAALSLVTNFAHANGNAEPAKATTVSAPGPSSVSIPAPQVEPGSPIQQKLGAAYDHSLIGPSVVLLINEKEDPRQYKADIESILRGARQNNVPLKVFGFRTTDPSSVHIILDRIIFTKHGSGIKYSTEHLLDVGAAAELLYEQSLEYKAEHGIKTSATAPDVTSSIR